MGDGSGYPGNLRIMQHFRKIYIIINGKNNIYADYLISLNKKVMNKGYLDFVKQSAPKIICVGKNYLKHVIEMGGT